MPFSLSLSSTTRPAVSRANPTFRQDLSNGSFSTMMVLPPEILIHNGHFARSSPVLDVHAIVPAGVLVALPEHQLIQPAPVEPYGTQIVDALFSILVVHHQTRSFESQPHFSPGSVKRIVQHDDGAAAGNLTQTGQPR